MCFRHSTMSRDLPFEIIKGTHCLKCREKILREREKKRQERLKLFIEKRKKAQEEASSGGEPGGESDVCNIE